MQSGVPEELDMKPSFCKPLNDAANRKYRRYSGSNGSDSSSDGGSPKRERSPVYSMEDHPKSYDGRRRRDERREVEADLGRPRSKGSDFYRHSERQTYDSRRHDDYGRYNRYADAEDRSYHRSSHLERDSRSGSRLEHTRCDSHYDRLRENWQNLDKYPRDGYENVEHRSKGKERELLNPENQRHGDRDSDRAVSRSKHVSSSKNDKKTGERDREAWDERRECRRSPGGYKNGHAPPSNDSGCAVKDTHKSGEKYIDGQKDDQVQKRKYSGRESDKHKYARPQEEEMQIESKSLSSLLDRERKKENMTKSENSSDKKLKLGNIEDEKFSSPKQDKDIAGKFTLEPTASAISQADLAQDLDAAKVKAMKAAELVNRNLVGGGTYLSTDQKKKLLWGNKKNNATEESSNRWDLHSFADREQQEKFKKLMGVKGDGNQEHEPSNKVRSLHAEQQEQLKIDLEKQYTAGLRRRDGRTVGLGL